MNIDEKIWPLPNAFNIREGSPFGRSEKFVKEQLHAIKSSKAGQSNRAKSTDRRFRNKAQ